MKAAQLWHRKLQFDRKDTPNEETAEAMTGACPAVVEDTLYLVPVVPRYSTSRPSHETLA